MTKTGIVIVFCFLLVQFTLTGYLAVANDSLRVVKVKKDYYYESKLKEPCFSSQLIHYSNGYLRYELYFCGDSALFYSIEDGKGNSVEVFKMEEGVRVLEKYSYDSLIHPISITRYKNGILDTVITIKIRYERGNLVYINNGEDVTEYFYNEKNELIKEVIVNSKSGVKNSTEYLNGKKISTAVYNYKSELISNSLYSYNKKGQLLSLSYPKDGTSEKYYYDKKGNNVKVEELSIEDNKPRLTAIRVYMYDKDNRLILYKNYSEKNHLRFEIRTVYQ